MFTSWGTERLKFRVLKLRQIFLCLPLTIESFLFSTFSIAIIKKLNIFRESLEELDLYRWAWGCLRKTFLRVLNNNLDLVKKCLNIFFPQYYWNYLTWFHQLLHNTCVFITDTSKPLVKEKTSPIKNLDFLWDRGEGGYIVLVRKSSSFVLLNYL